MVKRIQLSRKKGYRKPNAVVVSRPTKWGNPWTIKAAIEIHELEGKDLACWFPLDKPCHADELLDSKASE